MKPNSPTCVLLLALALSACAAQPPRYLPTPHPTIPALPADLATKQDETALCRELLTLFSASQQALDKACGSATH